MDAFRARRLASARKFCGLDFGVECSTSMADVSSGEMVLHMSRRLFRVAAIGAKPEYKDCQRSVLRSRHRRHRYKTLTHDVIVKATHKYQLNRRHVYNNQGLVTNFAINTCDSPCRSRHVVPGKPLLILRSRLIIPPPPPPRPPPPHQNNDDVKRQRLFVRENADEADLLPRCPWSSSSILIIHTTSPRKPPTTPLGYS